MSRKRYRPKETIAKLREADMTLSSGGKVGDVVKAIGVHGVAGYRWRKEHNGRVERSCHRDDDEFCLPFPDKVCTEAGILNRTAGSVYSYNLERPHYEEGMGGRPPFRVLQELGYDRPDEFALFPPLLWIGSVPTGPSGVVTISWPTTAALPSAPR